jgi:hypothetical protein
MSRNALLATAALAMCLGLAPAGEKSAEKPKAAEPAYRLSGPYTQGNLTLFLIHGDDALKNRTFLTLDEALEQKKIVVHETKNVNQLSIENVSGDVDVFIGAGDIVKGGDQDRVLAFDMLVPPKSGKLPIHSFCVESGRWRQRAGEENAYFSSSKDKVATKGLNLANRLEGKQDVVWKRVEMAQKQLSDNLKTEVKDAKSASSLQLSLENKKVLENIDSYTKKLSTSLDDQKDVIGFAFAINGQVNSADVYASGALFKKLWPKLLKASAIEAVAELKPDKTFPAVTTDQVKTFMADAAKGKKSEKEVTKRLNQILNDGDTSCLFETLDRDQKNVPLRRNYLAK